MSIDNSDGQSFLRVIKGCRNIEIRYVFKTFRGERRRVNLGSQRQCAALAAVKFNREVNSLEEHPLIAGIHRAYGIYHRGHIGHGHSIAHPLEEIKYGGYP